jgi:serine/threonine-protein kinase
VLGDFGVARLVGEQPLVDDRAARGTLGYMPPEQRRGELPPAADVYAAGVILVEMLRGSPALTGWLSDRGALLRGTARWDGALPDGAAEVRELTAAMLDDDAARRPTAAEAARRLAAVVNRSA